MLCNITPVATGDAWIGYGVRSFNSVIRELIREAKEDLVLTAYLLTSKETVEEIKMALNRGVNVEIYLYDDNKGIIDKKAVDAIISFEQEYPYLHIILINKCVLHAKILVVDGKKVLAGSANLTHSAMSSNYELGFLVENSEVAGQILGLIHKMVSE